MRTDSKYLNLVFPASTSDCFGRSPWFGFYETHLAQFVRTWLTDLIFRPGHDDSVDPSKPCQRFLEELVTKLLVGLASTNLFLYNGFMNFFYDLKRNGNLIPAQLDFLSKLVLLLITGCKKLPSILWLILGNKKYCLRAEDDHFIKIDMGRKKPRAEIVNPKRLGNET